MANDETKPIVKKRAARPAAKKAPVEPAGAEAVSAKPKKARAVKAAPVKPAPDAAPAAPKPARKASEKTVKVTQTGSPIGRQGYQRATLKGLGLNKLNRSRVLVDTPAVRGMIERVKHLLRIEAAP